MKRNCTDHPIIPEINSVTNVNETDRWVCTLAFKDQVNSVINICAANTPEHRDVFTCGNYLIDLEKEKRTFSRSISDFPLWGSCTYRVHSKCGNPEFSYSSLSGQDVSGQFDIAWTAAQGITVNDDLNEWDFNFTSSYSGSMMSGNGGDKLINSAEPVTDSEKANCTGYDRDLWVTITRVMPPTPPSLFEDGFATPRVLDNAILGINLQFSVAGSAQFIKVLGAVFVAVFATLSF